MRRYRFGLQPKIAGWNLVRLAEAFLPLVDDVPALEGAIEVYESEWTKASRAMIAGKMGLREHEGSGDDALWESLTQKLKLAETDMTVFFRRLSDVQPVGDPLAVVADAFYEPLRPAEKAQWLGWFARYRERLSKDEGYTDRKASMDSVNPWFVLRNYLAQEAIELAEKGDFSRVHELLDAARTPYVERPEYAAFAAKRPEWARNKAGCSMLSCSS